MTHSAGELHVALRIKAAQSSSDNNIFELDSSSLMKGDDGLHRGHVITITDPHNDRKSSRKFMFDSVFSPLVSQATIFEQCAAPMLERVLSGFNSCLFVHGQTGSGKSHTIFGDLDDNSGECCGIFSRTLDKLFKVVEQRKFSTRFELFISMYEIYGNDIGDLGSFYVLEQQMNPKDFQEYLDQLSTPRQYNKVQPPSSDFMKKQEYIRREYPLRSLEIISNSGGNPEVTDLSNIPFKSKSMALKILERCLKGRAIIEKHMKYSSRVHTILSLTVKQHSRADIDELQEMEVITGRLHFVELAGGEQRNGKDLIAETIEKTISTLASTLLTIHKGESDGPFHESKLTSTLQADMEQNCFITLIATLSPLQEDYEESLATLQFAYRCKNTTGQPAVNYVDISSIQDKDKRIKELEDIVLHLHKELKDLKTVRERDENELKKEISRMTKEMSKTSNRPFRMEEQQFILHQTSIPNSNFFVREISERDKKLDKLSKENAVLQQKLDKNTELTNKLQNNLVKEENEHNILVSNYRKKIQDLSKQVTQMKLDHKHALERHEERFNKTEEDIRNHYEKEINDLTFMVNEKLSKTEEVLDPYAEYDKRLKVRMEQQRKEADFIAKLQEAEKTHKERQQVFDELIRDRDRLVNSLQKEFKQYKSDMEREIKTYDKEVSLLYEYSIKLSHIIHQMGIGAYPVQMRFNTKSIRLTECDRPEPVRADLLPHLQGKMKQVNEFIRMCESRNLLHDGNNSFSILSLTRTSIDHSTNAVQKPSISQQIELENKYNDELSQTKKSRTRPGSHCPTNKSSNRSGLKLAKEKPGQSKELRIAFNDCKVVNNPSNRPQSATL